jgi:hypothetical protein
MTAPIASGWSGCRVGLAPTGKRRLCTAHANNGSRELTSWQKKSRPKAALIHPLIVDQAANNADFAFRR